VREYDRNREEGGHGARNDFENIVREGVQGREHSIWMEVIAEGDKKPKKEEREHRRRGQWENQCRKRGLC
jgi:hypothetical protein